MGFWEGSLPKDEPEGDGRVSVIKDQGKGGWFQLGGGVLTFLCHLCDGRGPGHVTQAGARAREALSG